MTIQSNPGSSIASAGIYTDLQGLQQIKRLNRESSDGDNDEALRAVAKQFESIFVTMMMKSMRDANEAFRDEAMGNSNEMQFYEQMFDQQLGLSLAQGGGIGIADALVRQLKQGSGAESAVEPNPFSDYLSSSISSTKRIPLVSLQTGDFRQSANEVDDDPQFESPQDFIQTLLPMAQSVASALGVDARYLVSQAALETGWGQYMIKTADGSNSFNLFGIKAGAQWQGATAQVETTEYRQGVPLKEVAEFRAYESYAESFADYLNFVTAQDRYADAVGAAANGADYLNALQSAGYATDPNYASKILNIVDQYLSTEAELAGEG